MFNPEFLKNKVHHKERIIREKIKEISDLKIKIKEKETENEILREEIISFKRKLEEFKMKEKSWKEIIELALFTSLSSSALKNSFKKKMKEKMK